MSKDAHTAPATADPKAKKVAAKRALSTAAERVKRASRGRPPLNPDEPTTSMPLRLTVGQRAKAYRLGGAAFLRRCIDEAPEPAAGASATA